MNYAIFGLVNGTKTKCQDKKKHKNIPSEAQSVFCELCGKSFTGRWCKDSLRVHHRTVHLKIRKYDCRYCNMKFTQIGSQKRHMKICPDNVDRVIEVDRQDFQCVYCGKLFNQNSNRVRHESKFCPRRP